MTLTDAAINMHQTPEFFWCLKAGCNDGKVNYDRRAHDSGISGDKAIAAAPIHHTIHFLSKPRRDKLLALQVRYHRSSDVYQNSSTSILRQVLSIEYAVYLMAIITMGAQKTAPQRGTAKDFGIAACSIRYRFAQHLNCNH
jgi:hypothetical protein